MYGSFDSQIHVEDLYECGDDNDCDIDVCSHDYDYDYDYPRNTSLLRRNRNSYDG